MPFDLDKFDQVKIQDRVVEVPVPELKMFFDEEEEPLWVVRALGAIEVSIAREAREKSRNLEELIEKLTSESSSEKVEAVMQALNLNPTSEEAPAPLDYVWRIALLYQASVNPEIDEGQAVRLALMNSTAFYRITNKVLELIGEGQKLGE